MYKIGRALISLAVAASLLLLVQGVSMAQDAQFVGNKMCVGCHMPEKKAWEKDYHAKALESLKPGVKAEAKTKGKLDPNKDFTTDASCLACHATGYGKPAAAGAVLDNVGCESCHGPGSKYRSPKIMSKALYAKDRDAAHKAAMAAGLVEPSEKLCVECHNDKSPTWKGFDYAKMIEEVKHKK
jgi:cytochrome c551/c552